MKTFLFTISFVTTILPSKGQTITDMDGNSYNTVTIGTQIWTKENLKTTKLNDGTLIPNVTTGAAWDALTSPGYCWYNNDPAKYKPTDQGALYNWHTVNTGKLCPTGWHVPSNAEWSVLSDYLTVNGYGYEGSGDDIAKSMASKTGWKQSTVPGAPGNNPESNNSSNFSAILSGSRDNMGGIFLSLDYGVEWWSATEASTTEAFRRSIAFDRRELFNYAIPKAYGISVRCLKDGATAIHKTDHQYDIIVYPNPTCDMLYIKDIQLTNAFIFIYDIQGRLIKEKKLDSNKIDISDLIKGMYIIKIIDKSNTYSSKITKD